jgi:hypothetical protein
MDDQNKNSELPNIQNPNNQALESDNANNIVSTQNLNTNKLHKRRNMPKKPLLIICGVLALLITVFNSVYLWNKYEYKQSPVTTDSSSDHKTEEDLATIGTALSDYSTNAGSTNSVNQRLLPSSLNELKLKNLNYSLSNYQYKYDASENLNNQGGNFGPNATYTICVNFQSNTFTADSYSNYLGGDGTQALDYGVHDSGKQCFDNLIENGKGTSGGLSIDLNSYENKLVPANSN